MKRIFVYGTYYGIVPAFLVFMALTPISEEFEDLPLTIVGTLTVFLFTIAFTSKEAMRLFAESKRARDFFFERFERDGAFDLLADLILKWTSKEISDLWIETEIKYLSDACVREVRNRVISGSTTKEQLNSCYAGFKKIVLAGVKEVAARPGMASYMET